MSSASSTPARTHGTTRHYGPLILAAICLAIGLHTAMPVRAAETGIRGTVLRGPIHPGPSMAGQSDEAPFRATFTVSDSGRKVARFESAVDGRFEIMLPPGQYAIIPDATTLILFPGRQEKIVTVPEDGFAEVTLRFDTGMR